MRMSLIAAIGVLSAVSLSAQSSPSATITVGDPFTDGMVKMDVKLFAKNRFGNNVVISTVHVEADVSKTDGAASKGDKVDDAIDAALAETDQKIKDVLISDNVGPAVTIASTNADVVSKIEIDKTWDTTNENTSVSEPDAIESVTPGSGLTFYQKSVGIAFAIGGDPTVQSPESGVNPYVGFGVNSDYYETRLVVGDTRETIMRRLEAMFEAGGYHADVILQSQNVTELLVWYPQGVPFTRFQHCYRDKGLGVGMRKVSAF